MWSRVRDRTNTGYVGFRWLYRSYIVYRPSVRDRMNTGDVGFRWLPAPPPVPFKPTVETEALEYK